MDIMDEDGFELIKFDPKTQKSLWAKRESDGTTVYRSDQPVDHIVKENQFLRNDTAGNRMGDYVMTSRIPMNVLFNEQTGLINAFKGGDDAYIRKWENDSDNRAWRVNDIKV